MGWSVGVVTGLVAARMRHAGGRWRMAATGIALCAVVPVLAAGAAAVTADAALHRAVAALPIGERNVTVAYGGSLEPAAATRADRLVRSNLPALGDGAIRRELLYRELSDGQGGTFVLSAADDLGSAVRLVDGRLPAQCAPTRCEVVDVVAGGTTPRPASSADTAALARLGLVVVGHVERSDPLLLTGSFDPSTTNAEADAHGAAAGANSSAAGSATGARLLIADGVDAAATIQPLTLFQRAYGWVQPLDVSRVQRLGVDGWVGAATRVADLLNREQFALVMSAPDKSLRAADARARASARRFVLLGGTAAVLLLGTAVTGGAALRRDHSQFVEALRRRGAGPGQVAGVVTGEVAITVIAAGVAGMIAGGAIVLLLADRAGLPVAATAADAMGSAAPATAALLLVCGLLLALALTWPEGPERTARSARWAVGAGAAVCVAVAALLAARGGVSTGSGTDPLLAALPALVLLAAALLSALAWQPVAAAVRDRLPRRALAARLGLAAVVARPLRAVTTVALVTAAVGAAVFAGAYRATLIRGAADQAAFAVPMDARITTGPSLRSPLAVTGVAGYGAARPGGYAAAVLRRTASVRIGPQQADAVQLVGVEPAALTRVVRWQALTGDDDAAGAARGLATVPGDGRQGVALPTGRRLRIATASAVDAEVTVVVRTADGRERAVQLTPSNGGLDGVLPDLGTERYLGALTVRQDPYAATHREHSLGEAGRGLAAGTGRLSLGAVSVDGAPVSRPWAGWAGEGLAVTSAGSGATLTYELSGSLLVLDARPGGLGTSASPLPVLTDLRTAASGRNLTLVLDQVAVPAIVVGTLDRFPTTTGRFAVTDLDALARLTDRTNPGAGQPDEVWLSLPGSDVSAADRAALDTPAMAGLSVSWRSDVEEALRTDPVARGAVLLLLGGAALTLAVALAALVLLVVTERHDDSGQLYAWEADGARPRTLRGGLWWRSAAVAVPAVPAGVLAGLLLARLTARLVAVTAGAGTPQPPLVPGAGAGWASLAVCAGLAVALGIAALVAATSLRQPLPEALRGAP